MSRFMLWRYTVARWFIHLGLHVMPASNYKADLTQRMWDLNAKVRATVERGKMGFRWCWIADEVVCPPRKDDEPPGYRCEQCDRHERDARCLL